MEADVLATSSHLVCFNITEENRGNAEKHRVMQVGDRSHHGYFSRKKETNRVWTETSLQ